MNKENETFFGDKHSFAIRYVPGYSDKSKKYFYAYCHLVLNGQIIGDQEETCYLSSWKCSLELLKDQIKNNFQSIIHSEFKNRSDNELFELILKANQFEDEYKLEFSHLPVLDNKVWSNCYISIDETTDAFLITMTELNGKIKFLWKEWQHHSEKTELNNLHSVVVDSQFVIETIEKCLQAIENEYLNYPIIE